MRGSLKKATAILLFAVIALFLCWPQPKATAQIVNPPAIVPIIKANQTGLTANVSATTLTTPSANGLYRASCATVETIAGTTAGTLPNCNVNYTDVDTNLAETTQALSTLNTGNVVGPNCTLTIGGACVVVYFQAKSGVPITYSTAGYATAGAQNMTYAVHVLLEGPF